MTMRHGDYRIPSRNSEGEILWPEGELAVWGAGHTSRLCGTGQMRQRMNQVEESWPAGALEGLSSIQPLVGALGPNRARLCPVDFKWQGLRRHPQAAVWRRRCLQLASEIPMWKGPLSGTISLNPLPQLEAILFSSWILHLAFPESRRILLSWGGGKML